jgi:hypothetical protein
LIDFDCTLSDLPLAVEFLLSERNLARGVTLPCEKTFLKPVRETLFLFLFLIDGEDDNTALVRSVRTFLFLTGILSQISQKALK